MSSIKSPQDIEKLKKGGHILATVLQDLKRCCLANYKSGTLTTRMVDDLAGRLLADKGVAPSFKGHMSPSIKVPFSGNICISVNDEIVHGEPGDMILREGDLISIDMGVIYEKLFTDATISFTLGKGSKQDQKLLEVTEKALEIGIREAVAGNTTGDIGHAIEEYAVKHGFGLVREYAGHGVGYAVHESPSIPNYGKKGSGIKLEKGMVLAIEPMVTIGSGDVKSSAHEWVVKTRDGGNACHFEHTVAVTDGAPLILTRI